MARTAIGLDIGSTGVRAVELGNGGGRPTLLRIAQQPLPAGAVAGGEIREPRQVAEAIRELWHLGKFQGRQVVLGVGNQRVVVREVVLPWLEEKELRESLPFQVREFVPIPIEDAILDYQVVEEFEQDGRHMVRLMLAAAQKGMVGRMVEAVESAKLQALSVDLVPFAIVRSAGSNGDRALGADEDPSDEAVVDIGAEVSSICVHSHGHPRFVRMVAWGGRNVTSAIARSLGVTEPEAERMKRGLADDVDEDTIQQAEHIARQVVSAFADDLRSSLDFYRSQNPAGRIGHVLLTGGGSKLAGLADVVKERLVADVGSGHPFNRVSVPEDLPPEVITEAEPLLAVAVGLAIPGGEE
ncbi:MAG: type IV pilus assembly protein PilM [Actinomycetota bacterium]